MSHNDPHSRDRLAGLRQDYRRSGLSAMDLARDPLVQFQRWFDQAVDAGVVEPNAMTIATADRQGRPSARVVLLKGISDRGMIFYTNYDSRKGRELETGAQAALVFWWQPLERQVRVEGNVARVPPQQSDLYFHSRPRGSQLGAVASAQSRVAGSREALEHQLAALANQYPDGTEIPRPDHWGGYEVAPHTVEFWQGRSNRLHDRLRYQRDAADQWELDRLFP